MLKLVQMEAYADAAAGPAFRRPAAARGARPRARSPIPRSCCSTSRSRRSIRSSRSACAPSSRSSRRDLGISFVHVTHSQEEAMALADLIVVMNDGRIEQAGDAARGVRDARRTAFVARFMGDHNVISGRVDGARTARASTRRRRQLRRAGDGARAARRSTSPSAPTTSAIGEPTRARLHRHRRQHRVPRRIGEAHRRRRRHRGLHRHRRRRDFFAGPSPSATRCRSPGTPRTPSCSAASSLNASSNNRGVEP